MWPGVNSLISLSLHSPPVRWWWLQTWNFDNPWKEPSSMLVKIRHCDFQKRASLGCFQSKFLSANSDSDLWNERNNSQQVWKAGKIWNWGWSRAILPPGRDTSIPPWFSSLESLLFPSRKGQRLREAGEGQNESKEFCFQEIGLYW